MELTKAIIVDSQDFVSKALPQMQSSGLSALVLDSGKYVGIIDERDLREKKLDPAKTKCSKIAVKTPVLQKDSDITDICTAFFAGRFKTLPVMDGSKVLGVVDRWAVLSAIEKTGYLKGVRVSDHMSSPIMTINSHASASVANAIMREANVRRLAVLQNGGLVGMVSVFDLLPTRQKDEQRAPKMKNDRKSPENLPVYSFMNQNVEVIEANEPLLQAVKKMISSKRAALVVVDANRPVGIITSKDILKAAVESKMATHVIISGLSGLDKELENDITAVAQKMIEKMKNQGVNAVSMHIKNERGTYFVSAHVKGDVKYRAHSWGYELMAVVREVIDAILEQARRNKETKISQRKNV